MADTQVLIIGAGPTGLTLANILGMYGVRTIVAERNPATVCEPRAVSIDDESLRTMQFIDLAQEVRSGIVEGYGSYYYSPSGSCFARVVPESFEYGYARRSAFRQPILEAQLRQGLARFETVEARFSATVTHLAETEGAVSARIQAADGSTDAVRAQYVVACDGAKSGTRQALGIAMSGSTYDERWLIVDLVGSTDRFRHTRVYCDPTRPALALPGPDGTRRYEFMLLPGERPEALLEESRVRSLLARHSQEDARLEIVRSAVYQFHARIAERWRCGPVFLAGDAAHLSPPFAGQGMNSGVRDAHNLGWKLAHVLRGDLDAGALDSYESERKPHAWALIQMAVDMGRVMMPGSRLSAALVQSAFRALSLYPPARNYVLHMKYKPKPRFAQGLMSGDAGSRLRGAMLAQPLVERRDGAKVLLDEVLGKSFAIIEWDDGRRPLSPLRADRLLDARSVRVIPRDHRFVSDWSAGAEQVRDVTGTIDRLFDQADVRGVLVRPDRYVAAGLARSSDLGAADRALESLVRAAKPAGLPAARTPVAAELAIA